jgi:VIT1/CCC1 family predicted Fe2+/Mn2+ transporter
MLQGSRTRSRFTRVFLYPIGIAMGAAVGLVLALIGDGVWDATSWIAVGLPIPVVAWFMARRTSGRRGV